METLLNLASNRSPFQFMICLFILVSVLSLTIALLPINRLKAFLEKEIVSSEEKSSLSENIMILTAIIIAPLSETLVFQWGLISLIIKVLGDQNNTLLFALVVSTVLFALAHKVGRTWFEILPRIPLAFALALIFICYRSFKLTFMFHFVWNILYYLLIPYLAETVETLLKSYKTKTNHKRM